MHIMCQIPDPHRRLCHMSPPHLLDLATNWLRVRITALSCVLLLLLLKMGPLGGLFYGSYDLDLNGNQ